VEKMIRMIMEDTAMPVHWGLNQPGMQASEVSYPKKTIYSDGGYFMPGSDVEWDCEAEWKDARDSAISRALAFHAAGYHKQIVNRLLEPFMHITVLVTATEWENFFSLRIHPDAQPEIRVLAEKMYGAMQSSEPNILKNYQWHLPFLTEESRHFSLRDQIKMSVARCARTSYLTHEGKEPNPEKDFELYHRLVGAKPWHASPTEHQAQPARDGTLPFANFRGWIPFRGILEATNPIHGAPLTSKEEDDE